MDWGAPQLQTDFRYVIVDRTSWGEVGEITDITDGTITRKYLSELKEGATLNYCDTAQLLDIGFDYLRVYLDASDGTDSESVALGTFMVSTPQQSVSDTGTSGTATCYSLLQIAADEGLDGTLTVPAGTNLIDYAAQLLTDRGLRVDVQSTSSATAASDAVFGTDSTVLDVAIWCTQAAGFGTPLLDGYGTVILQEYTDPSSKRPVRRYGADSRVMFPAYGHELDAFSFPNKVVVVCSTPDSSVVGTAVNSDPAHPYSTVSRGRTVTATYEADNLTTTAQANARAALLLSQQSEVESVTIEHLYDGGNLQDVVQVMDRGDFSIVEQEIRLQTGCPVSDRARRFVC